MTRGQGVSWGWAWQDRLGVAGPVGRAARGFCAREPEEHQSANGEARKSGESVVPPAKRKRSQRATVGNKLKGAKKDTADSNLAEVPAALQKDSGTRRTKTDILEQEVAGASGEPRVAGCHPTTATMRPELSQTGQPAMTVSCGPTPGASGQGLQVGLGKMMEAMHSFMASAKALASQGTDDKGSSSTRACAGQVWGQGSNSPPKGHGEVQVQGVEGSVGPATDALAGASGQRAVVRLDPPLLSGRSSLAWRVPVEARERIWNREFIDIFSLLTFAKEGADITVPTKEVEKNKWKRKVKPEESIENWLEAFAMLSTMLRFPEQGPALCKYNRVIYEEYTRNGGTGWLNYDREFRQKMEQAPDMAWDCHEIELWVHLLRSVQDLGVSGEVEERRASIKRIGRWQSARYKLYIRTLDTKGG
ncbi:hypothetical protein NDU88_003116 [Pleurodeles waltl]|uniref:Uncharacterized protein n=1 Tax=Pleurodeles waltl TaxID=8319 RepID=A0AAV7NFX4_PLEWA|nr:hypothetical protein NDU88_003116 [Pleurodeles waltl]